MLLGLVGVQDEGFEGGKRAQWAFELWWLALVLQVVAPHLVELAAHGTGVAEHLITHVHLPVSWKQRNQVSQVFAKTLIALLQASQERFDNNNSVRIASR